MDRLSDLAASAALQPEVEAAVDAQIDTIRAESSLLVLREEVESLVLRLDACGESPEAEYLRGRVQNLRGRVQTLLESGSMALSFSAAPVTTPVGVARP